MNVDNITYYLYTIYSVVQLNIKHLDSQSTY